MLTEQKTYENTKKAVLQKNPCFKKYLRIGLYVCVSLVLSAVISVLLFRFYQITPYLMMGSLLFFLVFIINVFRKKGIKRKILWKFSEKILIIPTVIWMSVFVFGIICHPLSVWLDVTMPSSDIRFPLSGLEAVAVDEIGNVYCLSTFYNRLQVFDNKGQFMKGWFVDLPGGDCKIRCETTEEISIFSKNTRVKMKYSIEGILLSIAKFEQDDFIQLYPKKHGPLVDGLGNSYAIESPFFWIKVVKTSSEGDRSLAVKDPLGLWLMAIFFPFVWFVLAKVLIFTLMRKLLKG